MSFKNAIKILINKFGLVWIVLLYLVICSAIVVGLSVAVVIPVTGAMLNAGVGEQMTQLFHSIMNGEGATVWVAQLQQTFDTVLRVLRTDLNGALNSTTLIILVTLILLVSRFLIGLYELPLVAVLEGAMSADARIGFTGEFISKLGLSSRYVLTKMLFTVSFDVAFYTSLYYMFALFTVKGLALFAPFIIMIAVILILAFRYTLISLWAPSLVVGGKKIFPALFSGVRKTFKNFWTIYSTFIISWTILIALNILVGLFTFGAGLVITIPVSMTFINILNMTIYYNKSGKRYYTDAVVVTPPVSAADEQE